jgi:hypothetical protein
MNCPSCDSSRLHPSRLRGLLETLRYRLSDLQPYRCHGCNWRGWRAIELPPSQPDTHPDDLRGGRPGTPVPAGDLDPLDPNR